MKYCTKEDSEPFVIGTLSQNLDAYAFVANATSLDEVREEHPEIYVKSFSNVEKIVKINNRSTNAAPSLPTLRKWQAEAISLLEKQTDRQVLFVVDREGNTGKSKLALHLRATLGNKLFYCDAGGGNDVAHALSKGSYEYAIFDYPRSTQPQYLPWRVIEGLKNGVITSPKYDSDTIYFNHNVKILVLTNHDLDSVRPQLSRDRWSVLDLDERRRLDPGILDLVQQTDPVIPDPVPDAIPQIPQIEELNNEFDINGFILNFDFDAFNNDLVQ